MKACAGCSVWIPDDAAFCPSCGKALTTTQLPEATASSRAPGDFEARRGRAEPGDTGDSAGGGSPPAPAFDRAKAESTVRMIGMLFMAAGGWTILSAGWQLAMVLTGRALEQVEALRDEQFIRDNPDFQRGLDLYLSMLREPGIAAIPLVLALGLGAFYLWSGLQLRDLRGRTMAFASAILLIVLFPCSAECCGCCFTVPVGVAALVVLTRADTTAVLR